MHPNPLFSTPDFAGWLQSRRARVAADQLLLRDNAKTQLLPFMRLFVEPDLVESNFLTHLTQALEKFVIDLEAGRSPRLMVFAPPRHGKSHAISRALPSFILGRNPKLEVIAASATQDLADEFGLFTRNILNNPVFTECFPGCEIDPSSNAISRLTTLKRGGYRGVGVGSQIVGRGAHCLILDDPIAGRAQAYSATERTALSRWYFANARTRLAPGGGIIIMHQRWHIEDLASVLLASADRDPDADQWHVLSYPAVAGVSDPHLGRLPGEPLCPERWPLAALRQLKAGLPVAEWNAMYQQSPINEEGGFFKRDTLHWYDDSMLPSTLNYILSADYATSAKASADHTAILAAGLDPEGDVWIHPKAIYGLLEPDAAVAQTIAYAKSLGARVLIHEKGVIANLLAGPFKREQARQSHWLTVERFARTTAKHIQALPIKALMGNGKVHLPQACRAWMEPLLLNFNPDADGEDDFVDALAGVGIAIDAAVIRPAAPEEPTPEPEAPSAWMAQSAAFREALTERKRELTARTDDGIADW
jgi:hypothetical protein